LGLGTPLQERVVAFHKQCQSLGAPAIQDVFISETITQDNTPQFLHLIFFAKPVMFEIPNFVGASEIQIARLSDIEIATYATRDLDIQGAKIPVTQVRVLWYRGSFAIDLHATRTNCEDLMRIWKTYIAPRVFPE